MLHRYIHSMKRQTYDKCVLANDWNIKVHSFLNICHLYDPGCSIQSVLRVASEIHTGHFSSPSILIKLRCLFVCLCVYLFVCPQTTPRELNEYRQSIPHRKRNFPGTKVIYFRTGYDYLVRKYTKKTNFGPPKFLIFFRCTKCRNFFL